MDLMKSQVEPGDEKVNFGEKNFYKNLKECFDQNHPKHFQVLEGFQRIFNKNDIIMQF